MKTIQQYIVSAAFMLAVGTSGFAQNVGINTTTPAATLDIFGNAGTATSLDGLIAPRLTGDQLRAKSYTIAQTGAIVYVTLADTNPAGQTLNVTAVGYYYFSGTVWVSVADTASTVSDTMVFSAEYAGASLNADGSNNLGDLTSNNTGGTSWMNYYSWSNTQNAGGTNDYDIILRFKLPANFTAWSTTNAIEIDHAGTSDANFTANVYAEGSSTAQATLGATTSSSIATWATASITSTGLTLAAGDTGILVLHMTATDNAVLSASEIRLGDITLNFTRTK